MANENEPTTALKVDTIKDSIDQEYIAKSFEIAVAMGGLLMRAGYNEKMSEFSLLASEAFLEKREITLAETLGRLSLIETDVEISVAPLANSSNEDHAADKPTSNPESLPPSKETKSAVTSEQSVNKTEKNANYYIRAHTILANYYDKEAVENLTNAEIERIINSIPNALRAKRSIDGRSTRSLDLNHKRLVMWLDGLCDADIAKSESVYGSSQISKGRASLLVLLSENITFAELSGIANKDTQTVKKN